MANTDTWILATIESDISKLNGTKYWRLGWYNCDTGEVWEMTVDSSYDNWLLCNWRDFLRQEQPFGVYENVHTTNRHTQPGFQRASMPVVSADYAPVKLAEADPDTLGEVIGQLERDRNPTPVDILNRFMEVV